MTDEKLAHEIRNRVREFWRGIFISMEDPDSLIPLSANDQQRMLAYCYYLALLRMTQGALNQIELENTKVARDNLPKREIEFSDHHGIDAKEMSAEEIDAQISEINKQISSGKLVYIDDVLASLDAVLESIRADMLALPLASTSVSTQQLSIDQIQEVCARELK